MSETIFRVSSYLVFSRKTTSAPDFVGLGRQIASTGESENDVHDGKTCMVSLSYWPFSTSEGDLSSALDSITIGSHVAHTSRAAGLSLSSPVTDVPFRSQADKSTFLLSGMMIVSSFFLVERRLVNDALSASGRGYRHRR
jgi:hypothetical protein